MAEIHAIQKMLSFDALRKLLDPIQAGAEDARAAKPETDEVELDPFSARVRAEVEAIAHEQDARLEEVLQDRVRQIREINVRHVGDTATSIYNDFEKGAVPDAIRNHEMALAESYEVYQAAHRHYEAFKLEHDRTLEARPASPGRQKVSVIILTMLVEAGTTAHLLQAYVPLGYVSAIPIAMAYAFVLEFLAWNVGADFVKRRNYLQPARALRGGILAALSVIGIFLVVVAASNGRTFLVLKQAGNNPEPLNMLGLTYWTTTAESIALFVVGAFAAFFTMIAGYYMSGDRYPGYAQARRERDDALADHAAAKKAIRAELRVKQEEAMSRIDAEVRAMVKQLRRFQELRSQYDTLTGRRDFDIERARGVAQQLIDLYRSSNRAARGDARPPSYFDSQIQLSVPPAAPRLDLQVLEDDLVREHKKNEGIAVTCKRQLQDVLRNKYEEIDAWLVDTLGTVRPRYGSGPRPNSAQERELV